NWRCAPSTAVLLTPRTHSKCLTTREIEAGLPVALREGMKMSTTAAALAILCSFAAHAGGLSRTFGVGAVVVASASVSTALIKSGSHDAIDVRTGGYRAPPPALLVNGEVKLLSSFNGARVAALNDHRATVTVLY
ncbi:MAG: hypothetical protein ACXWLR_02285, partial [Myxococcales bacterium]